eukprot:scaffold25929_cov255-Cylindrotheca_fusiformis.AAC.2
MIDIVKTTSKLVQFFSNEIKTAGSKMLVPSLEHQRKDILQTLFICQDTTPTKRCSRNKKTCIKVPKIAFAHSKWP